MAISWVARKVLVSTMLAISLFGAGYLTGMYFGAQLLGTREQDFHDHGDEAIPVVAHLTSEAEALAHEHEEEEGEHVALTPEACKNLGLKLSFLAPQDYWKSQTLPGEVVEIEGRSRISVSAPVTGVIEKVLIRPGQLAEPTDQLFTLRITDEQLLAAQSKLLAGISRADVLQQEVERLAPLTETGAVAARRLRDLKYELAQLTASQAVLRQEILSRGLPERMIEGVTEQRRLANTLRLRVPEIGADTGPAAQALPISQQAHDSQQPSRDAHRGEYFVQQIRVQSGQTVERGELVCTLMDHTELQVRGEAFQTDLPMLDRLGEENWIVTAEFGHDHLRPDQSIQRKLKLLRVDNTIGAESQTVTFYMPLFNEATKRLRGDGGSEFVHWRFKPGQRVHLRIPVEKWEDQWVLPLEAVMIDGPNAVIFAEHLDHHVANPRRELSPVPESERLVASREEKSDEDEHDPDEETGLIELEPIPVHVLHRDDRFVVISRDAELETDQRVALNGAYELYQAMKSSAEGGGHHHHHDH